MLEPLRILAIRSAPATLVDLQQRGIHDAVGEGLQSQDLDPGSGLAGMMRPPPAFRSRYSRMTRLS